MNVDLDAMPQFVLQQPGVSSLPRICIFLLRANAPVNTGRVMKELRSFSRLLTLQRN